MRSSAIDVATEASIRRLQASPITIIYWRAPTPSTPGFDGFIELGLAAPDYPFSFLMQCTRCRTYWVRHGMAPQQFMSELTPAQALEVLTACWLGLWTRTVHKGTNNPKEDACASHYPPFPKDSISHCHDDLCGGVDCPDCISCGAASRRGGKGIERVERTFQR